VTKPQLEKLREKRQKPKEKMMKTILKISRRENPAQFLITPHRIAAPMKLENKIFR
jgi:hypothetical protein